MDHRDAQAAAPREPVAEPAALPWGMDKTDVQKSSLTALTDEKLARFVIGQQKKTKYEKEREERELKKRKADEEAAAMYAKFVASFEDEDDSLGKAFVRSGGDGAAGAGEIYRLQGAGSKKKLSEMDRLVEEMQQKQSAGHGPPSKKRREMDLLVEEIKSREISPPTYDDLGPIKTGSFDTGDPETTNLYVGNLAPSVTEEKLERVFSKYGRINSIKIMWPRSEEERSRRRMSGFVSFFTRREADDARVHVNDSELDGQRIVVGWGKAVKIQPTAPAFPTLPAVPAVVSMTTLGSTSQAAPSEQPKIVVQVPTDDATRRRIDHLAAYVAKDGLEFENAVRLREANNQHYAFLSSNNADAIYYRWRVYAFVMGDSEDHWRDTPFQMTLQGPVWIPPAPSTVTGSRLADDMDDRCQQERRRSRSRSHSRSGSGSRGRRSRSRSRGNRSRSSRSNHRGRSGSRDRRRRRSRSRSYSSSSSDRSDWHRRSRSRSRSRGRGYKQSKSPRQHGSEDRRCRGRSRSPSRSRTPAMRRDTIDDPILKKDETMLTGQQLARARDLERGREPNRLARDEFDRFTALLDSLTLERESIKNAMGCALDNSECAIELVQLLRKRFHRDDVTAVQLVGYLYVVSDILHNSSAAVKNASLFRTTFQECLPEIIDRLRRVHRSIQGRMSALAMRDKVLAVLTAWGSWSLFPPHYLVGLNATFMRKAEEEEYLEAHKESVTVLTSQAADEEKLRKMCSQAGIMSNGTVHELVARLQWLKEFTAPATTASKSVVSKIDVSSAEAISSSTSAAVTKDQNAKKSGDEEDVDGEPMDENNVQDNDDQSIPRVDEEEEDLDGEPLDQEDAAVEEDVDGEPLDPEDDLDGEPLDEDEQDMDGEPLDEDLDGEPL